MDIAFQTRKLEKTFNAQAELQKNHGDRRAKVIMKRMKVLRIASNLAQVPFNRPERRHQLSGNRDEQFAVDLDNPYRLVFEPDHEPLPRKEDGGIDLEQVTAIRILRVEDYH